MQESILWILIETNEIRRLPNSSDLSPSSQGGQETYWE